jgi:hypothetical protein
VGEQTGFLEDDAEGAAVGRHEMAACLVLPDLIAQREVTPGVAPGRPWRAGVVLPEPEWPNSAVMPWPGRLEVDIEGECTALDAKAGLDRLAHRVFRLAGLKV